MIDIFSNIESIAAIHKSMLKSMKEVKDGGDWPLIDGIGRIFMEAVRLHNLQPASSGLCSLFAKGAFFWVLWRVCRKFHQFHGNCQDHRFEQKAQISFHYWGMCKGVFFRCCSLMTSEQASADNSPLWITLGTPVGRARVYADFLKVGILDMCYDARMFERLITRCPYYRQLW